MRYIIDGQNKSSIFDNSKPWYLLGIVSFGTKTCGAGNPAIYTRWNFGKGKFRSGCVSWWMLGNKILPCPPWTILPYSLPKVVLLLFSSVQGGVLHTLDSEDHKGLTQLTFKKAIATNYVLVFYVHTWNKNYKNTLNLWVVVVYCLKY